MNVYSSEWGSSIWIYSEVYILKSVQKSSRNRLKIISTRTDVCCRFSSKSNAATDAFIHTVMGKYLGVIQTNCAPTINYIQKFVIFIRDIL